MSNERIEACLLFFFFFNFYNGIVPWDFSRRKFGLPSPGKASYPTNGACWVFQCFRPQKPLRQYKNWNRILCINKKCSKAFHCWWNWLQLYKTFFFQWQEKCRSWWWTHLLRLGQSTWPGGTQLNQTEWFWPTVCRSTRSIIKLLVHRHACLD